MVALDSISRDLTASERVLGSLHPDLAVTLNNLAVLSTRRGDHTKAVQNAKRAVEIYKVTELACPVCGRVKKTNGDTSLQRDDRWCRRRRLGS